MPFVELDRRDREPQLTAGQLERQRLGARGGRRRRRHRHGAGDRRPAGDRLDGGPADDLVGREPCDRLGRAVPEADDPVAIEHEDAVADVLEHPGRIGAALDLGEQQRVVDGHRGPASELLRGDEVGLLVQALRLLRKQRDRPQHPATRHQRRRHQRRHPDFAERLEVLRVAAAHALQVLVGHLRDQLRLAAGDHAPGAVRRVDRKREALQELVGGDPGLRVGMPDRHPLQLVAAEHVDDAPLPEIRDGEDGQALQGGRVVERRAEQLARLREELEPPAGGSLAFVEPRLLDRERHPVGQQLHRPLVVVREDPRHDRADVEDSQQPALDHQRHPEQRLQPALNEQRIDELGALGVRDEDGRAGGRHPAGEALADGDPHAGLDLFLEPARPRGDQLLARVVEQQRHRRVGAHHRAEAVEQVLQQPVEIEVGEGGLRDHLEVAQPGGGLFRRRASLALAGEQDRVVDGERGTPCQLGREHTSAGTASFATCTRVCSHSSEAASAWPASARKRTP